MRKLTDFPDAELRIFDRHTPECTDEVDSVYLIGICGTGMGSLAGLFQQAGYHVTGSDDNVWPPMSTRLRAMGIDIIEGYSEDNLRGSADLIIVGNACTPRHVEAAAARERQLVQQSFPEALADFFIRDRRSLVVAGTHGKTTTTSMLVHIFEEAGQQPGFLVGGVMKRGDRSYAVGAGKHFIVEGDEYDSAYFDKRPKFMHYDPGGAIVTSMEFDHADIYDSMTDYRQAFQEFVGLLPDDGTLVLCADAQEVLKLSAYSGARTRTYGLSPDADVRAARIRTSGEGQQFDLIINDNSVQHVSLPMNGRHNLLNALAACTLAVEEGLAPNVVAGALRSFRGVRRRQEVRGEAANVLVVDDFAHHPTAVRATIQAAAERWPDRRLVAVFEPRSNSSRRKIFEDGYTRAFTTGEAAGVFISTPPYRHNDRLDNFMDVDALVDSIRSLGISAEAARGVDTLLPLIDVFVESGDIVLIMSNGGFGGLHERLLAELRER